MSGICTHHGSRLHHLKVKLHSFPMGWGRTQRGQDRRRAQNSPSNAENGRCVKCPGCRAAVWGSVAIHQLSHPHRVLSGMCGNFHVRRILSGGDGGGGLEWKRGGCSLTWLQPKYEYTSHDNNRQFFKGEESEVRPDLPSTIKFVRKMLSRWFLLIIYSLEDPGRLQTAGKN